MAQNRSGWRELWRPSASTGMKGWDNDDDGGGGGGGGGDDDDDDDENGLGVLTKEPQSYESFLFPYRFSNKGIAYTRKLPQNCTHHSLVAVGCAQSNTLLIIFELSHFPDNVFIEKK